MKHTLESLLTLASTDEGKQQICVMVAEACGYQFRDETWSEMKGVYTSTGGFIGLDKPEWHPYPEYTSSLDAIMPEVRKLDEHGRNRWINYMADIIDPMGELEWRADFAIATAEHVHRCIALLLSLNPVN